MEKMRKEWLRIQVSVDSSTAVNLFDNSRQVNRDPMATLTPMMGLLVHIKVLLGNYAYLYGMHGVSRVYKV